MDNAGLDVAGLSLNDSSEVARYANACLRNYFRVKRLISLVWLEPVKPLFASRWQQGDWNSMSKSLCPGWEHWTAAAD